MYFKGKTVFHFFFLRGGVGGGGGGCGYQTVDLTSYYFVAYGTNNVT